MGFGELTVAGTSRSLGVLLDACPDAVVVVDTDGLIVHVNEQVSPLLGYASSELVGQPLEILVPEGLRGDHARHRDHYQSAPASRAMADGADLHARHRDGHEVPVDIALAPLAELAGRPVTAAFVRDASERRRSEQRRRRLARAEAARRHALEINDSIIQGLAVAQYELELGNTERAATTVRHTARAAQVLVEQLLGQGEDVDGADDHFVRSRPALSEQHGGVAR